MAPPRHICLLLAALPWVTLPATSPLKAADLHWDPLVSAGTALGGSGSFTDAATAPFWWNGSSNVPWTDLTGVDTAVLNLTPDPGQPPPLNTVSIPDGITITANGLTYAVDGYTLAGPGTFNFRNNSATASAPATLTIPAGLTGAFTAANNQNSPDFPTITITGGGTLTWAPAGSNGTKITLEGGTTVNARAGNQGLGSGTNHLNHGTYRLPPGGGDIDNIYDSANFTSDTGEGYFDLNGSSEVIGAINGTLQVTNGGHLPSTLSLSGNGTQTFTGLLSDGLDAGTGLTLTGSANAADTGVTSVNNNLIEVIGKAQTYSGDTTLRRGTLRLAYNHTAAAGTGDDLLYHGLPAFPDGSGSSRLVFGGSPPSAASTGTGGRTLFEIIGASAAANSQRFNGMVLEPYAAAAIGYTVTSGSTFTLDLGAITRGTGSTLNIGSLARMTVRTPTGTANSIVAENGLPWLTIAAADWAFKDSSNTQLVVPPPGSYAEALPTQLPPGGNVNLPSGVDSRLPADTSINSLRINLNERRTLSLGGHTLTVPSILLGNAIAIAGVSLHGGALTSPVHDLLFIHQAGAAFRYSGLGADIMDGAAGPMTFTRSGSGATHLTGNNHYSGSLVLAQGTLIVTGHNRPSNILIQGNTANSSNGPLPVQSSTTTLLQLGNANDAGSLGSAPITIGGLSSFAVKRSDTISLTNPIGGSGHFQQAGSGTTILGGPASSYTWRGDTTVSGGVLLLDNEAGDDGKIPDQSALRMAGGTLRRLGGGHTEIVSRLDLNAGASTIELSHGSSGRFRLNAIHGLGSSSAAGTSGATLNFSGPATADTDTANTHGILGATARLTVGGADWATSAEDAADTPITAYSGYQPLSITAGTDSNPSILAGASATLTGSRTTHSLKIDTSGTAALLDIGSGQALGLTSGGLLLTGSNGATLTNGSLYSPAAVSPDLLIHHYAAQPVTIHSAITFGNTSTGQSHVTFSGPGTTILTGTNTYGGITYLNGGIVSVASDAQLGGSNGTIGIDSSATNSAAVTLTSSILPAGFGPGSRLLGQTVNTIHGTALVLGGNAATTLGAGSTAAWATGNTLTFNRGTLQVTGSFTLAESNSAGTGGTMTLHRPIVLNGSGGTMEITGAHEFTLTGNITGPGGLVKTGTGTLLLANPNGGNYTATGPMTVAAGTVRMEGSANGLPFNSDLTIAHGATVDLNGLSQTIGSLAGAGILTNHGPTPATATIGTTFSSSGFGGVIQDGSAPVSLTKTGSGNLVLTSANLHSGNNRIEAGILTAGNPEGSATGTGDILVGTAGTLAGTGSLAGSTSLHGILAPGNPCGSDTTDALSFENEVTCHSGSVLRFEIGGKTAGSYDQLKIAGSFHLATAQEIELILTAYTPAAGDAFDLVDAAAINAPETNFSLPVLPAGLVWNTAGFAVDGTVSVEASGNLYQSWRRAYFDPAELADPAVSGPAADPDHDGLANAIEFAAGTLPRHETSGGSAALPVLSITSGRGPNDYPTLTFLANSANLPGVSVQGQSGTSLTAWPDAMTALGGTVNGNGTTTLVFRSKTATREPGRRFYRLVFTPLP